jgi:2',3'-cyclic-nucleotide 2'-phosphodiesterase
VATLRGEDVADLPPYELADGPMTLGAVVVTIDGNRSTAIERVS